MRIGFELVEGFAFDILVKPKVTWKLWINFFEHHCFPVECRHRSRVLNPFMVFRQMPHNFLLFCFVVLKGLHLLVDFQNIVCVFCFYEKVIISHPFKSVAGDRLDPKYFLCNSDGMILNLFAVWVAISDHSLEFIYWFIC